MNGRRHRSGRLPPSGPNRGLPPTRPLLNHRPTLGCASGGHGSPPCRPDVLSESSTPRNRGVRSGGLEMIVVVIALDAVPIAGTEGPVDVLEATSGAPGSLKDGSATVPSFLGSIRPVGSVTPARICLNGLGFPSLRKSGGPSPKKVGSCRRSRPITCCAVVSRWAAREGITRVSGPIRSDLRSTRGRASGFLDCSDCLAQQSGLSVVLFSQARALRAVRNRSSVSSSAIRGAIRVGRRRPWRHAPQ
jgi:hypothetical protein